jgi:metal-dependent hydrolase (beta-lactamase superfamily II)
MARQGISYSMETCQKPVLSDSGTAEVELLDNRSKMMTPKRVSFLPPLLNAPDSVPLL